MRVRPAALPVCIFAFALALPAQSAAISYEADFVARSCRVTFTVSSQPNTPVNVYVATRTTAPRHVETPKGPFYLPDWANGLLSFWQLGLDAAGNLSWPWVLDPKLIRTSMFPVALQWAYWDGPARLWRFIDQYLQLHAWSNEDGSQMLVATYDSATKQLSFGGRYQPGAELTVYARKPQDKSWTLIHTRRGSLLADVAVTLTLQGHEPGDRIAVRHGDTWLLELR